MFSENIIVVPRVNYTKSMGKPRANVIVGLRINDTMSVGKCDRSA